MADKYRVLVAAGGTGGHIFPAISIADALRELNPDVEIEFVGTRDRMEWIVVPNAGYKINNIWISGFHRRLTMKNILFPVKLTVSLLQSRSILRRFRPDVVVACGGFVAGPAGWVAGKMKIPVVLQEQNSFPGVTNRLLAKKAQIIFTAFQQAEHYFPKDKIRLMGNPTRKSLLKADKKKGFDRFGFNENKPTLLVMGGSGGARALNDAMLKNLDALHDKLGLQIIWQCGTRYYDDLKVRVNSKKYANLRLLSFLDHMAEAYAVSDLVISRAGAISCAELTMIGKPSILIPSPNVAGDHQTKNAMALADNGATILLKDKELNQRLYKEIEDLYKNPEKLNEISAAAKNMAMPDAAKHIAEEIITLIEKNYKRTGKE